MACLAALQPILGGVNRLSRGAAGVFWSVVVWG